MRRIVSSALALFVAAGHTIKAGGSDLARAMTRRAAGLRQWRARRWLASGATAALTLTVVMVGAYGLTATPVHAGGLPVVTLPPPLLSVAELSDINGLFYATSAQVTALSHLEDQAVQNTLADHNLPASDANAVSSWGRDDAEAELWNLLRQAITATTRTTDQQAAVDWLTSVAFREGVASANFAGLEYTKWAGLSVATYNSLVSKYDSDIFANADTTADKTNLQNFLAGAPLNYNSASISTATGGYCAYKAPTPFQTEYSYNGADCTKDGFFGCLAGCISPTPDLAQFEKWGAADANNNIVSNPSFTQTAQNIALGLGLGGIAASVGATVGISLTMAGVMAGTAFEASVFPFAATPWFAVGTGGAYILPEFGAVAASGVGAIVGAVLLFIAGTTLQAINLANFLDTPGKVAGYVEGAQTDTYNLASMLNSQSGAGELYSLFVDATLPPPPPAGDSALPFPETDCAGSFIDSFGYNHICLDPPVPPAYDPQLDPAFMVSVNGGTATLQKTISWYDAATKVSNTAYLDRTWFVDTVTTSGGTVLQAKDEDNVARTALMYLRIHYTDWSGNEQTAYLFNLPQTGYEIVSTDQQSSATPLNPDTCVTDKTCVISTTLQYVDSAGVKSSATVIPAPKPVISQTLVINPIEGSAATLQATASSPVPTTLTYSWQIQDKPLSTGFTTCLDSQFNVIPCPPPTVTVTGNPATYVFPTSGSFAVTLTVTNAVGASATSSFTLTAADVAPTLALNPACDGSTTPCNALISTVGAATTLGGAVTHSGAEDVEALDINWGDGSKDDSVVNTSCYLLGCPIGLFSNAQFDIASATVASGKIRLPFSAVHTYANIGDYTVTARVTDQSGVTTSETITESMRAATTTSLTSNANPSVWGQPVTLTAAVASALAGNPSGTVAFKDGGGVIAGCGARPVDTSTETATCVTSALSVTYGTLPDGSIIFADPHALTATYSGDSVYATSASATLRQRVGQAATTTSLATSVNPSVWGQPVTFTAKVTAAAPGAGTPTGTVTFSDGATVLGTGTLSASGGAIIATYTISGLAVNSHTVTAAYAGDDNFTGSSSAALSQTVNKASATTTVTSANTTVAHGQPVTFTAKVAAVAPGAGTPTGMVTFMDGGTVLGSASLGASGGGATATFTTSGLAAGARSITAVYNGDGDFLGATSAALTQYVNNDLSSYPKLSGGGYNLSNANLANGSFVGENLSMSSLYNGKFAGAFFISANLSGADMSNANFSGATFSGANLTGVNLSMANLKGAIGLGSATLTGVNWNGATCPDGTIAANKNGTCIGHL